MTVEFQLAGQRFMALNGGPTFKFTEAISLMIDCETQKELDAYWDKLSAGGREVECGWLKDKYGLSWQVVPSGIGAMLSDPKRGPKVAEALWRMKKLDIESLRRAYESA
jgi:predicted 3-demethylubiquinone-9 3-methyltransferase (glyoxalase superfamily)